MVYNSVYRVSNSSQRIARRFTKGCRRSMQDDDQADP